MSVSSSEIVVPGEAPESDEEFDEKTSVSSNEEVQERTLTQENPNTKLPTTTSTHKLVSNFGAETSNTKFDSLLHQKLKEANLNWISSLSQKENRICRDLISTMRRTQHKLDSVQVLAVNSSNNIRSNIDNLRSAIYTINAINQQTKLTLPQFNDTI